MLTDRGYVVVSELSWLKPDLPEEIKKFFAQAYPRMKTIKENLEIARRAGYRIGGCFLIPEESWWDNYYTPVEAKIPSLKSKYRDNKEALRILDCEELEIEMYCKYSDYYGYVFYVMQIET